MQPVSLLFALGPGLSNTILCGNASCAINKWGLRDCDVILRPKDNTLSQSLVVTDYHGNFFIAGFDPGYYTVIFQKEGYLPFEKELLLRLGTLRFNVELIPDKKA